MSDEISLKEIYQAKGGPIAGIVRWLNKNRGSSGGGAGTAIFISDVKEGNGTAQNIPHGFDEKPSKIVVIPVSVPDGMGYDLAYTGSGTANVIVTAPAGVKYKVLAIK